MNQGGSSCRGTGFMETNLWQGLRALDRLLSPWTAVLEVRAVSNHQVLWPASSNLKGAVCSLDCPTELARSLAKVITEIRLSSSKKALQLPSLCLPYTNVQLNSQGGP